MPNFTIKASTDSTLTTDSYYPNTTNAAFEITFTDVPLTDIQIKIDKNPQAGDEPCFGVKYSTTKGTDWRTWARKPTDTDVANALIYALKSQTLTAPPTLYIIPVWRATKGTTWWQTYRPGDCTLNPANPIDPQNPTAPASGTNSQITCQNQPAGGTNVITITIVPTGGGGPA